MGTRFLRGKKQSRIVAKLNDRGFIPLILTLLVVLVAIIILVYMRVQNAQK